MKETYYFSHDYNSRSDEKIKKLIMKHGFTGYGIFWAIIEDLYSNANALRTDYECIAFDLRVDESMVKSIVTEFDLFVVDGDIFGSSSVERRLNERAAKSKKAANSANSRWGNHRKDANALKFDANALRPECDSNAIKESKVKESKEKKSKVNLLLSEIEISDVPDKNKDYFETAKAFQQLIRKNITDFGGSTKDIDNAKMDVIDQVRLIIESDNHTLDDCRNVFKFLRDEVPRGDFSWKKNILSFGKLREKFNKLKIDANAKDRPNNQIGKKPQRDNVELAEIMHKHISA